MKESNSKHSTSQEASDTKAQRRQIYTNKSRSWPPGQQVGNGGMGNGEGRCVITPWVQTEPLTKGGAEMKYSKTHGDQGKAVQPCGHTQSHGCPRLRWVSCLTQEIYLKNANFPFHY